MTCELLLAQTLKGLRTLLPTCGPRDLPWLTECSKTNGGGSLYSHNSEGYVQLLGKNVSMLTIRGKGHRGVPNNANGNEANAGLVQVSIQLNPMVNSSDFHLPGSP